MGVRAGRGRNRIIFVMLLLFSDPCFIGPDTFLIDGANRAACAGRANRRLGVDTGVVDIPLPLEASSNELELMDRYDEVDTEATPSSLFVP